MNIYDLQTGAELYVKCICKNFDKLIQNDLIFENFYFYYSIIE